MTIRKPLRDALTNAWRDLIQKDYTRCRINSERSLQAAFWSRLNSCLPDHYQIFIEPMFRIATGTQKVYPDIVICRHRRVVGVIEIKYLPRTFPRVTKDLRTLNGIAESRSDLTLSNKRFFGEATQQEFRFASKPLFVWAGVHRPPKFGSLRDEPQLCHGSPALQGLFLQLHAETSFGGVPDVFSVTG